MSSMLDLKQALWDVKKTCDDPSTPLAACKRSELQPAVKKPP
eukprot:CAMPEP_0183527520 /NCGR_PEP_ID=MMETSP0371-20130417/22072_1 /TAXON_ID=268820 /ORGANISM="Peridinium aciculiferum, Strain PAER-2" /LENGTH=41 /DNA_ID= /DNA_START= /DNA_END= /DNA_ORIENTATION=